MNRGTMDESKSIVAYLKIGLLVGCVGLLAACTQQDPEDNRDLTTGDNVGEACQRESDCDGDLTCRTDLPGGACVTDCNDGCPGDTSCEAVDGEPMCLATCGQEADCRNGYTCSEGICEPADNQTMPDAGAGMDTGDDVEPDAGPGMEDTQIADTGDDRDTGEPDTTDTGSPDCEETLSGSLETQTLDGDCRYTLEDTVTIGNEATVTVQAGAALELTGLYSFDIDGRFDVRGTDDNPVTIEATGADPQAGDWGNIVVGEAGTLRLRGAEVRHFSGIAIFGGSVEINQTTIEQVRPANNTQYDVDIDAALHLKQDATGEVRDSRIARVTGPDALGVLSFDADSVQVLDSVFENVEGTVFSINGFDSTIGATIEHNRIENSGGIAISEVETTTFEYNDLTNNSSGIWVVRDNFRSVDHSLAHNNFDTDGDYEISADGPVSVDATDSYWGGDDPADRIETSGQGDIDTSSPRDQPVGDAGPR